MRTFSIKIIFLELQLQHFLTARYNIIVTYVWQILYSFPHGDGTNTIYISSFLPLSRAWDRQIWGARSRSSLVNKCPPRIEILPASNLWDDVLFFSLFIHCCALVSSVRPERAKHISQNLFFFLKSLAWILFTVGITVEKFYRFNELQFIFYFLCLSSVRSAEKRTKLV